MLLDEAIDNPVPDNLWDVDIVDDGYFALTFQTGEVLYRTVVSVIDADTTLSGFARTPDQVRSFKGKLGSSATLDQAVLDYALSVRDGVVLGVAFQRLVDGPKHVRRLDGTFNLMSSEGLTGGNPSIVMATVVEMVRYVAQNIDERVVGIFFTADSDKRSSWYFRVLERKLREDGVEKFEVVRVADRFVALIQPALGMSGGGLMDRKITFKLSSDIYPRAARAEARTLVYRESEFDEAVDPSFFRMFQYPKSLSDAHAWLSPDGKWFPVPGNSNHSKVIGELFPGEPAIVQTGWKHGYARIGYEADLIFANLEGSTLTPEQIAALKRFATDHYGEVEKVVWDGGEHERTIWHQNDELESLRESTTVNELPPLPGTAPLRPGYVRLYHQTSARNLARIEREGIRLDQARGIEGPKSIYADEGGFYGSPEDHPTAEFQVPASSWDRPHVRQDSVPVEDILAAHYPWHSHARYIVDNDLVPRVLAGEMDDLEATDDYGPAIAFIKNKYGQKTESTADEWFPVRITGIGERAELAERNLRDMERPGHLYRGMESAEFDATIGSGRGVISRGDYSFSTEGTNFVAEVVSAESYVNFGRSDPRKTHKPTYIVEVRQSDKFIKNRQEYYEYHGEVPRSEITRVWMMVGIDDEVRARELPLSVSESVVYRPGSYASYGHDGGAELWHVRDGAIVYETGSDEEPDPGNHDDYGVDFSKPYGRIDHGSMVVTIVTTDQQGRPFLPAVVSYWRKRLERVWDGYRVLSFGAAGYPLDAYSDADESLPGGANQLHEVKYTDYMPKEFEEFRKKWMKRKSEADLFVNFTSYAPDPLERTPYASPDHSDPAAVYAYPLDYVIDHPADLWYGAKSKYLRVVQDTSKKKLWLQHLDADSADRLLFKMGFSDPEGLRKLAYKHYKDRIGNGVSRHAREFFTVLNLDLSKPQKEQGSRNVTFPTRPPAEQNALLRRAGFDAFQDTATTDKRAIVNQREPEQIAFLHRGAFKVLDTFELRAPETQSGAITTNKPDNEKTRRKLAAAVASALDGDKITKESEAERYFWTSGGRRIEVSVEAPASLYQNRKMGDKTRHKTYRKSDPHYFSVRVRTELGVLNAVGDSIEEVTRSVGLFWRDAKERGNKDAEWEPEDKAKYAAKEQASRDEFRRKEREAENVNLRRWWPELSEDIAIVAKFLDLPWNQPTDDDGIIEASRTLKWVSYGRLTPENFDETWSSAYALRHKDGEAAPRWYAQLGAIVKSMMENADKFTGFSHEAGLGRINFAARAVQEMGASDGV